MSKLEMLGPAPEFWGGLLKRYPIVAVSAVGYYPHEHGTPSHNIPLPKQETLLLEGTLEMGGWPHIETQDAPQSKQIFALGALMYICNPGNDARPYEETKSRVAKLLKNHSIRDLEQCGVEPIALFMVDLDCPNTEENLSRIVSILETNYENDDWAIFDSGESYHIVFKKFVEPKTIPQHYGKIIVSFASTAPEDQRPIFEKIGNDLQQFWDNPDKIREVCQFINENISHYDDPNEKGMHYIVDLRWIYHSLLELLDYLDTREGGFGYLRISDKPGCDSPPEAIFAHRIERNKTCSLSLNQRIDLGKILGF